MASIGVTVTADAVLLSFEWRQRGATEWKQGSQCVPLTWTICHLTTCQRRGSRPWLLCSEIAENGQPCNRRVALLYASDRSPYFACRKCRHLAYAIEQENLRDRSIRRARKARLRLRGTPNLFDELPPRPKGMHTYTYNRLWGKALIAAERWADLQLAPLPRRP